MKNKKIVKEIAEAVVDYLKNQKKENLLGEVVDYLQSKEARSEASVVSPRKLTLTEKKDIEKLFSKLVGEVPTRIIFSQDEKLIDGLKISFKDRLWDFSLRKQISSITKI